MIILRSFPRSWAACFLTCVAFGLTELKAQSTVRIHVKDLADQGIHLIPDGSPGFDTNLNQIIGSDTITKEPALAAEKPFSVILHNGSGRTVAGYSLRYTHVDYAGKMTTHDVFFTALTGDREATVPPSGAAWVTPRRVVTHAWNRTMPGPVREKALAAMTELARLSAVTISLDAVLYQDGTFVGPNVTHAFEQATAIVAERTAVAREFVSRRSSGQSSAEIGNWLETLTGPNPDKSADTSVDTIDWSYRYRQQYAQTLVLAYKIPGTDSADALAQRMLSAARIIVKR